MADGFHQNESTTCNSDHQQIAQSTNTNNHSLLLEKTSPTLLPNEICPERPGRR
jgi:hypothetical protein